MRDHIELKLSPRIFAWVLVLIIMGLSQPIAIAQAGPGSSVNVQSTEAPKRNGVPPVSAEPTPPRCPAPGVPMPQRSSPTRHHTVTLSWTASLSSVNSEGTAVDYCVYRSQTKNNAEQYATALSTEKKNPKCNDCEQVNSIPVAGTRCIDDRVEDGKKYYYVVTAVNAHRMTSFPSNEAPADIPASTQPSSAAAQSPPTLSCRGESAQDRDP